MVEDKQEQQAQKQEQSLSREKVIARTSMLGIVVNILMASIKVLVGLLTSSIAIVSEGVNNAADVLNSALTYIGNKLAGKKPDAKHPFGYGRIEYITSLVISIIILVSGGEMLISSIKLIIHPAKLTISYVSLAIVAGSAVIKFILGTYTRAQGRKIGSTVLEALGLDSRNDSFASIVTIISAIVFLVWGIQIDAWAGLVTSALILKAGIEVLLETLSEIIGRPGDAELASMIYKKVRSSKGIINAADMMLHNYGPDAWSGSVNVELDHKLTVGEAYNFLHKLQLDIMHEHNVVMVFGIYAVDNDTEESKLMRRQIGKYCQEHEYVKSFHAVYREPETDKIYCDLIVDYKLKDWDALRTDFTEYMDGLYPGKELELTIETEFV